MNPRNLKILGFVVLLIAAMLSCSQSRKDNVAPKPEAFPRSAMYDSIYHEVDSMPVRFEVNSAARIDRTSGLWLNIEYPLYAATIFVTMTPVTPETYGDVLLNRRQRQELNIGSAEIETEVERISSGSFISELLVAPEAKSTPLQFIAVDSVNWVVSGTAFFHNVSNSASVDSLAPMVGTLHRDIRRMLSTLK